MRTCNKHWLQVKLCPLCTSWEPGLLQWMVPLSASGWIQGGSMQHDLWAGCSKGMLDGTTWAVVSLHLVQNGKMSPPQSLLSVSMSGKHSAWLTTQYCVNKHVPSSKVKEKSESSNNYVNKSSPCSLISATTYIYINQYRNYWQANLFLLEAQN